MQGFHDVSLSRSTYTQKGNKPEKPKNETTSLQPHDLCWAWRESGVKLSIEGLGCPIAAARGPTKGFRG